MIFAKQARISLGTGRRAAAIALTFAVKTARVMRGRYGFPVAVKASCAGLALAFTFFLGGLFAGRRRGRRSEIPAGRDNPLHDFVALELVDFVGLFDIRWETVGRHGDAGQLLFRARFQLPLRWILWMVYTCCFT